MRHTIFKDVFLNQRIWRSSIIKCSISFPEIVRIYDGNGSLRKRVYRTVAVPKNAPVSVLLVRMLRVRENILPVVGHFVWRSWGSSSDILGFCQSFCTENGLQIWFLCWTFCLAIQELLVRHFQNSSDMSDVTDAFREAWYAPFLLPTLPPSAIYIMLEMNDPDDWNCFFLYHVRIIRDDNVKVKSDQIKWRKKKFGKENISWNLMGRTFF